LKERNPGQKRAKRILYRTVFRATPRSGQAGTQLVLQMEESVFTGDIS